LKVGLLLSELLTQLRESTWCKSKIYRLLNIYFM